MNRHTLIVLAAAVLIAAGGFALTLSDNINPKVPPVTSPQKTGILGVTPEHLPTPKDESIFSTSPVPSFDTPPQPKWSPVWFPTVPPKKASE